MSRKLVKRSDYKSFWGVPASGSGTPTFKRMKGFTEFSISKNPTEYSRQYIDESFETTDVTGYSDSCSFSFDKYTNDAVLKDIAEIIDDDKLGTDAQREVVMVDFSSPVSGGGYEAVKATFAVIGDSKGDSTDAFTYGGNLKLAGTKIKGTATIATPEDGNEENVETITFTASSATE